MHLLINTQDSICKRYRLYPSDRQKLLDAKAYFEQALELQPSYAPARQSLAVVNRTLGTL